MQILTPIGAAEPSSCEHSLKEHFPNLKAAGICYGQVTLRVVWSGLITGPCEQERIKAQCTTVHQANSMANSLTVGLLTPH